MKLHDLRSGESVSASGKVLTDAEAAVIGAMLKANSMLTCLDLTGSSCTEEGLRLISEAMGASTAPLAELLLSRMNHSIGDVGVAARLKLLIEGACRPSLRAVDCSKQAVPAASAPGEGVPEPEWSSAVDQGDQGVE